MSARTMGLKDGAEMDRLAAWLAHQAIKYAGKNKLFGTGAEPDMELGGTIVCGALAKASMYAAGWMEIGNDDLIKILKTMIEVLEEEHQEHLTRARLVGGAK